MISLSSYWPSKSQQTVITDNKKKTEQEEQQHKQQEVSIKPLSLDATSKQ